MLALTAAAVVIIGRHVRCPPDRPPQNPPRPRDTPAENRPRSRRQLPLRSGALSQSLGRLLVTAALVNAVCPDCWPATPVAGAAHGGRPGRPAAAIAAPLAGLFLGSTLATLFSQAAAAAPRGQRHGSAGLAELDHERRRGGPRRGYRAPALRCGRPARPRARPRLRPGPGRGGECRGRGSHDARRHAPVPFGRKEPEEEVSRQLVDTAAALDAAMTWWSPTAPTRDRPRTTGSSATRTGRSIEPSPPLRPPGQGPGGRWRRSSTRWPRRCAGGACPAWPGGSRPERPLPDTEPVLRARGGKRIDAVRILALSWTAARLTWPCPRT